MNKNSHKPLVANINNHNEALAFQVLFSGSHNLYEQNLDVVLHEHPLVDNDARVDITDDKAVNGISQGLLGWGKHVIQLTSIDEAMPEDILAYSLQVSHCDQEAKEQARQHRSHVLLRYVGYDTNPYAQYDVLAIVAGIFADYGALMVVNLRAASCLPTTMLSPKQNTADHLEQVIATLLPSILYCGFVKYFIEGEESLWVRTVGADALYLPDFAAFLPSIEVSEEYFMIFTEIHHYIHNNNVQLDVGHTMQIGVDNYVKLRMPKEDEAFLNSEGSIFILEPCPEVEYQEILARANTEG